MEEAGQRHRSLAADAGHRSMSREGGHSLYDLDLITITGETRRMDVYRGRTLLIVNGFRPGTWVTR